MAHCLTQSQLDQYQREGLIFPVRVLSPVLAKSYRDACDELERRLGELPKSREVIAYCRGPYCVLSFEAVAALRSRGYRVRRLEDGYPEWKAAGLPVESVA